jgi:hypothetical protein
MRTRPIRFPTRLVAGFALFAAVASAPVLRAQAPAVDLPSRLSDTEFWQLITAISEPGGYFRSDNFLSNEAGFQYVIPELQRRTKPGGVYLGVGPEQNFTYIAALRPKLAIIFDIRRGNLHEHLLYKVLFEMSTDRADFVSRLFARRRPAGLDTASSPDTLFASFLRAAPDSGLYRKLLADVTDALTKKHGFALTPEDVRGIEYVYGALFTGGPSIDYSFPNFSRGRTPTYYDLMVQTDGLGAQRSYLANEQNYKYVRELQLKNLLVPVVGDFAGPKAIRAVGQYLKERSATATAFYTSNVEQYLFQQADNWRSYYENVATLPLDSSSTFIRSIGGNAGFRAPAGAPFGRLPSVLCSIQDLLTAYRDNRIMSYYDVIQMSR